MRKPALRALTASLIGTLLIGGASLAPAGASPRQAPRQIGALAPTISFSFEGQAGIPQFGAAAALPVTYSCSPTFDSPILPQLLGSSRSFSVQVSEDIAHNGSESVTAGARTINDLECNGQDHSFTIGVPTDPGSLPFLAGDAGVVVANMRICDLFGCTSASAEGTVEFVE